MSGTNPRDSIDLDELERQLKEAGARPENKNQLIITGFVVTPGS